MRPDPVQPMGSTSSRHAATEVRDLVVHDTSPPSGIMVYRRQPPHAAHRSGGLGSQGLIAGYLFSIGADSRDPSNTMTRFCVSLGRASNAGGLPASGFDRLIQRPPDFNKKAGEAAVGLHRRAMKLPNVAYLCTDGPA